MDEIIVVARAIEDALADGHCSSAAAARAAIAALDKFRGPTFMDVTLFDAGQQHGREAGLREAAAWFANLPGMMSGAAVAADILALIDE